MPFWMWIHFIRSSVLQFGTKTASLALIKLLIKHVSDLNFLTLSVNFYYDWKGLPMSHMYECALLRSRFLSWMWPGSQKATPQKALTATILRPAPSLKRTSAGWSASSLMQRKSCTWSMVQIWTFCCALLCVGNVAFLTGFRVRRLGHYDHTQRQLGDRGLYVFPANGDATRITFEGPERTPVLQEDPVGRKVSITRGIS